jgi:hypothetical protein
MSIYSHIMNLCEYTVNSSAGVTGESLLVDPQLTEKLLVLASF